MSRSTKQSTPSYSSYSYKAPEGYVDTESEADPTDAVDDPLEYETDRDRDVQEKQNKRRPQDVDSTRSKPAPIAPHGQYFKDTDFSETDPRLGLSPIPRVFLDYNLVDSAFLTKSIQYLKLHPRTLRSQSISEWRQRARCAVRGGDAVLARKFIQQAQLIRLFQGPNDMGDLIKGVDSRDFPWFIQKTYTLYLTYLAEAEADGLLEDKREEMLQPWRAFVQQAWKEDIMTTLLKSPYPLSSTSMSRSTDRADPRPNLPDRSRNSGPSPPKFKDNTLPPNTKNPRSSATYMSLPPRGSSWGDEEKTLTPSHAHTKSDTTKSGSRPERKVTDYRGEAVRKRSQTEVISSRPTTLKERIVTASSQTSRKATYEEVEVSEAEEGKHEGEGVREAHDEDEGNDEEEEEEEEEDVGVQKPIKPTTDRYGIRRDAQHYEHKFGPVNPRAEPRTSLPSNQTVQTRSSLSTGRGQDSTSSSGRSPSSTATPTAVQSTAPPQGLSDLMKRFIAQQNYQDCRNFCEANPKIFDEDFGPLQNLAVQYLQIDREESARMVIERRLMLQIAASSDENDLDWIKKLVRLRERQGELRRNTKLVLDTLKEALPRFSLSSADGPDTRPSTSRQALSTKPTKPGRY